MQKMPQKIPKKEKKINENICEFCDKHYDYQIKIEYEGGKPVACWHDGRFVQSLYFSKHDKKIIGKLPKDKVLVKGSDGVSRICDVKK